MLLALVPNHKRCWFYTSQHHHYHQQHVCYCPPISCLSSLVHFYHKENLLLPLSINNSICVICSALALFILSVSPHLSSTDRQRQIWSTASYSFLPAMHRCIPKPQLNSRTHDPCQSRDPSLPNEYRPRPHTHPALPSCCRARTHPEPASNYRDHAHHHNRSLGRTPAG